MAVKTTWEAHHACGHTASHDLAQRRPSERAGYSRWLATRDCADCWKAGRVAAAAGERARWLVGRRADELAESEAWETRAAMPALGGSDKAVEWGRRVPYHLLAAAHHTPRQGDGNISLPVENPPRSIDTA
ncbi:MAG: hypothetical protein ACYC1D_00485, partial [Acidimicrobiales bacterium]